MAHKVKPKSAVRRRAKRAALPAVDVSSETFADLVTTAFRAATKAAVREHLAAGRTVHGAVHGKLVEVGRKRRSPTGR
jgi:hypothetical protein